MHGYATLTSNTRWTSLSNHCLFLCPFHSGFWVWSFFFFLTRATPTFDWLGGFYICLREIWMREWQRHPLNPKTHQITWLSSSCAMHQHLLLTLKPIPRTKNKLPLFSSRKDPRSTSSLLLTLAQNPEYFLFFSFLLPPLLFLI